MLRAILAIALLAVVGGLAFFAGRATSPSGAAPTVVTTTPPPPAETASPQPPGTSQPPAPDAGAPVPEASRARTEGTPALPAPPTLDRSEDLKGPALPHSVEGQAPGDAAPLLARGLGLPIANLKAADIHDTFAQARSGGERRHEATDIMAAKGTPVVAVDTGIITKLFTSKPGGITVYQFDPSQKYAYYYAHLDRYAEGLREGMLVKKGDRIGYVGVTGNSDPNAPHLHFAIFELGPDKHWWEGKPINPYSILMRAVRK